MKRLLLLFIVTIVCSCKGNKVFYEYEDVETKTYAVLEISKKSKEVNYRALSDNYSNNFNQINGNKSILGEDIGINYFFDLFMIDNNLKLKTCADFDGGKVMVYNKNENDTIFLIKDKSEKIKCLEEYDITWFPPYMKKVDRINYDKFPEDIREAVIAIDKHKSYEKIQEILQKQKNSN